MDADTQSFLRAFDAVASLLRNVKQTALEAESRGDNVVEFSVDQAWSQGQESVLLGASRSFTPDSGHAPASILLKRLMVWKDMARQAQETGDTVIALDRRAIWEGADEAALVAWEVLRAKLIGQQPLFEEVV